jgi:hypothetical protein
MLSRVILLAIVVLLVHSREYRREVYSGSSSQCSDDKGLRMKRIDGLVGTTQINDARARRSYVTRRRRTLPPVHRNSVEAVPSQYAYPFVPIVANAVVRQTEPLAAAKSVIRSFNITMKTVIQYRNDPSVASFMHTTVISLIRALKNNFLIYSLAMETTSRLRLFAVLPIYTAIMTKYISSSSPGTREEKHHTCLRVFTVLSIIISLFVMPNSFTLFANSINKQSVVIKLLASSILALTFIVFDIWDLLSSSSLSRYPVSHSSNSAHNYNNY